MSNEGAQDDSYYTGQRLGVLEKANKKLLQRIVWIEKALKAKAAKKDLNKSQLNVIKKAKVTAQKEAKKVLRRKSIKDYIFSILGK